MTSIKLLDASDISHVVTGRATNILKKLDHSHLLASAPFFQEQSIAHPKEQARKYK
jgi:hypothetical protein